MSVATDRLSLCLPIDVLRHIDATIGSAQIDINQVLSSPDDYDAYASAIEDAEGEFKRTVGLSSRVSREGIPGRRETYEQQSYKVSGHKLTKGTFTGVWSEYLPQEQTVLLGNQRVLPFDAGEGDEVYFYTGLHGEGGSEWLDITDEQGELWHIVDHREGRFLFDPIQLAEHVFDTFSTARGTAPSFLRRLRFAISYRHGVLDRDSAQVGQTDLGESLDDSATGPIGVDDVEVLSRGRVSSTAILRIGREYVAATYDRDNGDVLIQKRGVRGTEAVSHESGETVMYVPPEYRKAVASKAAAQTAYSARYSGWLPDTEDSMDRSEVVDQLRQNWDDIVGTLGGGD